MPREVTYLASKASVKLPRPAVGTTWNSFEEAKRAVQTYFHSIGETVHLSGGSIKRDTHLSLICGEYRAACPLRITFEKERGKSERWSLKVWHQVHDHERARANPPSKRISKRVRENNDIWKGCEDTESESSGDEEMPSKARRLDGPSSVHHDSLAEAAMSNQSLVNSPSPLAGSTSSTADSNRAPETLEEIRAKTARLRASNAREQASAKERQRVQEEKELRKAREELERQRELKNALRELREEEEVAMRLKEERERALGVE